AYQNKIYFNTTGNSALATAGSGDVLTGLITGLLAQNYSAIHASILGVFLHGKSADIAIESKETMETFIASNGIAYLSKAIRSIN
ncbi:MAG: NAD(P)H-hydrate dehydratase, partial [Bacteroidetes bacterium]